MTGRVLIVEDEALVALTIEEVLHENGFDIVGIADQPEAALRLARAANPEIAIVDVRLAGGGDGIALAAELDALGCAMILFATANPAEVRRRATVGHGCLAKPFEVAWLLTAIQSVRDGIVPTIPGYFSLPVGDDP